MLSEDKYFQTLTDEELWQRYCGFLDLSVGEFMDIQNELLVDEIDRVADSTLGKKIMGNRKPASMEEFRRMVPLTTYEDYEPYLSQQQEDALADRPLYWAHSSGRGGKFKWLPFTTQGTEKSTQRILATMILAGMRRRTDRPLEPGRRVILNMAPRPYGSGCVFHNLSQRFSMRAMPPQEAEEQMQFEERIAEGFRMGLRYGIDGVCSIASVLVKIGERMSEQSQAMKPSPAMLHPAVLLRVARAKARARRAHRPMLPKDLWNPRALIAVGADAKIYKEQLEYYWGVTPYETYGATEVMPIAVNSWNKKWLTLIPDMAFYEFIPLAERTKSEQDEGYQPRTVLTDELLPGQTYEIVLTQLYGMPLLRYRVGDLITVADLKDEEAGIALPQIMFKSSTGGLINLAGLTNLDEQTLWRAITSTGIKCEEWAARKDYDQSQTFLRVFMELREQRDPDEVARMIDQELRAADVDYRDLGEQLGLQPVRVTLLSPGSFQRYYQERQKEGADLAHLKPPHMNASEPIVQRLMALSGEETTG